MSRILAIVTPREISMVYRGMSVVCTAIAVSMAAYGGFAAAGTTTVFKCFDRKLGVLYTDQPCVGEALEIRAGDADPVAVAELGRERESLSTSAAQRIADQRRAAYPRDLAAVNAWPSPGYQGAEYSGGAYTPVWFGGGNLGQQQRPRADAERPQRRERTNFVPNPPPNLRNR